METFVFGEQKKKIYEMYIICTNKYIYMYIKFLNYITNAPTYTHIHTYIHTYYIHTYIHTHTYILHTYIYTYIHTYILHTYFIHTYIHTLHILCHIASAPHPNEEYNLVKIFLPFLDMPPCILVAH